MQNSTRLMHIGYFGFARPPFADLVDEQAFLAGPTYQAAHACLRRNLTARGGVVLFTGTAGTGKTTLLQQLSEELADQARCLFFRNPAPDFGTLLELICEALNLRVPNSQRVQKLHALEVYLIGQLIQGRKVVVVLDDAHKLPLKALEGLHALVRLETAGQRLLQLVLGGRPPLETRLQEQPSLRFLADAVDAHCRLSGLGAEEVALYIRRRLRAAGYPGEDLFEPEAIRRVAVLAHGIPSLINRVCNQALTLAYLDSQTQISSAMIREVIMEDGQAQERPSSAPVFPESGSGAADTSIMGSPGAATGSRAASERRQVGTEPPALAALEIPVARRGAAPGQSRRARRRRRRRALGLLALILILAALAASYLGLPPNLERFIRPPASAPQDSVAP